MVPLPALVLIEVGVGLATTACFGVATGLGVATALGVGIEAAGLEVDTVVDLEIWWCDGVC